MRSPTSYARSSSVVILGTLVALLFAINFLTFVKRNFGPSERLLCKSEDAADVHVIRIHRDAAPEIVDLELLNQELDQARQEMQRAQQEMARAHADIARNHRGRICPEHDLKVQAAVRAREMARVEQEVRRVDEELREARVQLEAIRIN